MGDAVVPLDRPRRSASSRSGRRSIEVAWAELDSPVGTLQVATTEAGVVTVAWAGDDWMPRLVTELDAHVVAAPARVDEARRELDEYFSGRRRRFDLEVDWRLSHGFYLQVLQTLTRVGYGQVVTYGELAERAGRAGAARAVGSAMASNPVPIVVPCHRVLRRGGGPGGYSGLGGVETKRALLELEGVHL